MRVCHSNRHKWLLFGTISFYLIFSFVTLNQPIGKKESISELLIPSQPEYATSNFAFNRFVMNENFDQDVLSLNPNWNDNDDSEVTSGGGSLTISHSAYLTGTHYAAYTIWNSGNSNLNFTNARIQISWSWVLSYGRDAILQYKIGTSSYVDLVTKSNSDGSETNANYSFSAAALTGTQTALYFRIYGSLSRDNSITVDNLFIGTFNSTISDNSVNDEIKYFPAPITITVDVTVFGGTAYTNIDTASTNNFRIYYNTTNNLNQDTFSGILYKTSGNFDSNNHATLIFQTTITANTTFNYDFRILTTGSKVYRSDMQTIRVYDGDAPTLSSSTSPSSAVFEPNMDLKVTGTASDTGGAGLKQVTIVWGASNVNLTNCLGSATDSSSPASFEFDFDKSYFTLDQPFYYRLYAWDNTYLCKDSGILSITPRDLTKPQIEGSPLNNLSIGYQASKTLSFNITEAAGMSGVNPSTVDCSFSVGNESFSNAIKLTDFQQNGINWTGTIAASNFTRYNQTVYVWVRANDTANNQRTFTSTFTTLDLYAPGIDSSLIPTTQNLSAVVGSNFAIYYTVQDDSGGSGINLVRFCFGMNNNPSWDDNTTIITAVAMPNHQYKVLIPVSSLVAGSLNYVVRATDLSGNVVENSGVISLTGSIPSTGDSSNSDGSNNENNLNDFLPIIIAVMGVAIGSVIAVRVVMKKRAARFITKTDAIFSKTYENQTGPSSILISESPHVESRASSVIANTPSNSVNSEDGWANIQSSPSAAQKLEEVPTDTAIIKSEVSMDYMNKALNAPTPKISPPMATEKLAVQPLPKVTALPSNKPQIQSLPTPPSQSLDKSVSKPIPELPEIALNKPASKPIPELPPLSTNLKSAAVTTSSTLPPILETFTGEMRDLYLSAEEAVKAGEESLAIKSFETLLRMAETKGDSDQIAFIKRQIEKF